MLRTVLLASFALVAFAANSLLCRVALGGDTIDAASFGLLRLASGAATLAIVVALRRGPRPARRGLAAPAMLFAYVAAFSFAYTSLATGTGALLLFGSVQVTMIAAALRGGERFAAAEAAGLVLALGGLVLLVAPGLSAPPAAGSALMAAAGVAWGVYSLVGRGSDDPLGDTARNFALATPLAVVLSAVCWGSARIGVRGALLALASGVITSGLGYVVWFAALRRLSAIRAATVQLAVPAIAAAGGVVFLGERMTLRLALSAAVILAGVAVALAGRARRSRDAAPQTSPAADRR